MGSVFLVFSASVQPLETRLVSTDRENNSLQNSSDDFILSLISGQINSWHSKMLTHLIWHFSEYFYIKSTKMLRLQESELIFRKSIDLYENIRKKICAKFLRRTSKGRVITIKLIFYDDRPRMSSGINCKVSIWISQKIVCVMDYVDPKY